MDTSKTGLFAPTSMPESMMIKPSPTKLKPTTLFESPSRSSTVDDSSFSIKKTNTFNSVSSLSINHGEISPDQELRQFEAFEKAIVEEEHQSGKTSPELNIITSGGLTVGVKPVTLQMSEGAKKTLTQFQGCSSTQLVVASTAGSVAPTITTSKDGPVSSDEAMAEQEGDGGDGNTSIADGSMFDPNCNTEAPVTNDTQLEDEKKKDCIKGNFLEGISKKCIVKRCSGSQEIIQLRKEDLQYIGLEQTTKCYCCVHHYVVQNWSQSQLQKFYKQHNTLPEAAILKASVKNHVRQDVKYLEWHFKYNHQEQEPGENFCDKSDEDIDQQEEEEVLEAKPYTQFQGSCLQDHSYCLKLDTVCLCPPVSRPVQLKKNAHCYPNMVYDQLGTGLTPESLKLLFSNRSGLDTSKIGVYNLKHHTKECDNKDGCSPFNEEFKDTAEEVIVFYKDNISLCEIHPLIVIGILIKEAVTQEEACQIKKESLHFLKKSNNPTNRGAHFSATLKKRKIFCHCNDKSLSVSSGCSNHMLSKRKCKFAGVTKITDQNVQRFKLANKFDVPGYELFCNYIADLGSKLLKKWVPKAHLNMLVHLENARLCQIGNSEDRVFGGMTLVADYTAHSHFDENNYLGGSTAIFSFRDTSKQVHILTQYSLNGDLPGFAIVLPHRSVFFEVACMERHATARVEAPNALQPSRLGVVLYTHSGLTLPFHGSEKLLAQM